MIEGPWYVFKYRISNSSKTATLKLVTFKFYVTGFKNGIKSTNEYSLDPGADCAETKSRAFTVIVPPQATRSGYAADDSGEPLSHCDLEDQDPTKILDPDAGQFESWYIDGLPESSNLIYSIRIEGEGWFEEGGVITERAYISGFQVTR